MPTLKLDTIKDAALEVGNGSRTRIRTGLITGMDLDPTADPLALEKALVFLNGEGITENMTYGVVGGGTPDPDFLLKKIRIVSTTTPDISRVILQWQKDPFFNDVVSAYVIRKSTYMIERESDMIPGAGRQQIWVEDWVDPVDSNNRVRADTATLRMLFPMTSIDVISRVFGEPPDDLSADITYTNDGLWQGKARGYWLLSRYDTSTNKYSNAYVDVVASALSRVIEDWSEFATLRSKLTGQKVRIPQTGANSVATLLAAPYNYGEIATVPGMARYGPYIPTNFTSLFGFS